MRSMAAFVRHTLQIGHGTGAVPHWMPSVESKWRKDSAAWDCNAKEGDGGELRLEGELVDSLDYLSPGLGGPKGPSPLFTGDIKLDCHVRAMDGTGMLSIQWEFDGRKVAARFQDDGKVILERLNGQVVGDDKAKAEGVLSGPGWQVDC